MTLPSNFDWESLSAVPAAKPPAGVVPNFDHPSTRGPLFIALSAAAIGVMYLFLIVRFYSKFVSRRALKWDDCEIAKPVFMSLR